MQSGARQQAHPSPSTQVKEMVTMSTRDLVLLIVGLVIVLILLRVFGII
jgi:hypothetical protein